MEEKKNSHLEECKCPVCTGACPHCSLHGGYSCNWHWMKWILALIVLGVVFCAGFKFGMFFSLWGGGYRSEVPIRSMMSGWDSRAGGSVYQQVPMMRYYYSSSAGNSTSTGGQ